MDICFHIQKEVYKTLLDLFFIVSISHGVLDAMTSGGRGIGFLIPFSGERFFLPFRPLLVSPIGASRFFSEWGVKVIISEMIWLGLPCLLIWLISARRRK
jgi:inner membrane protein